MNLLHRRLCASDYWRAAIGARIVPWVLDGIDLGFRVLEVGPGPGAATEALHRKAGRLTCVEIDRSLAAGLAKRLSGTNVSVLCGDAARLSFADATFDGAVSLTMLHHVPSTARQDRVLAEVARVLRPGGIFAGFDAATGPIFRLLHTFDTMVVVDPATFGERLARAGFTQVAIDARARGFAFRAVRGPGTNA